MPDENPLGLGAFEFPLRFPGQYFDKETGLAYNYFRDYNPSIGRYVQSDPIGLDGGLNTYELVESDPLSGVDDDGLSLGRLIGGAIGKAVGKLVKPKKPSNRPPPTGKDREIHKPEKKPGMWNCKARADCNDNMPGNGPDDPWKRFAFGGGFSKSLGKAKNIAKSNATHNLGCQPKHVSCVCTGPKGETYRGGC